MKKKKRWLIYSGILILIILLVVWWLGSKKSKVEYSTATVAQGPLIQTVSETGTVKPIKELSLNFLAAGRISAVNVKIGDKVVKGDVLAVLDDSSLVLRRSEAEAGLNMASSSLEKILAGASREAVAINRSGLDQALAGERSAFSDLEKIKKTAAENIRQAEKTLSDLESSDTITITPLEQAVISARSALDNSKKTNQKNIDNSRSSILLTMNEKITVGKVALDNINTLLEDSDAKPVLSVKNNIYLQKTKDSRLIALELQTRAEQSYQRAKELGVDTDIETAASDVRQFLLKVNESLNYTYSMLEMTITSQNFSQTNLDAYKSIIINQTTQVSVAQGAVEASSQTFHNALLTYDTAVATASESLRQAEVNLSNGILSARNNLSNIKLSSDQQISSAQARLDSAIQAVAVSQAQLNNTLAPARIEDLAVSRAQVAQAQATLDSIIQQINDSRLLAPLDGVVTQVNYEVGEQFSSAKAMVVMLVNNNFNIEVDIAEANISKIKIGDQAAITLDAFPADLILNGQVDTIDPAQTVISDVVYYRVKVNFDNLGPALDLLSTRGLSLKSGMTANVIITTDRRDQVIQVPARAIIERDGAKLVRLLVGTEVKETPVTTGLRGDEGLIEITSGLKVGETVITFIKNNGATAQ